MKSNKAMTVKLLWQFENCVYILSARPLIIQSGPFYSPQ